MRIALLLLLPCVILGACAPGELAALAAERGEEARSEPAREGAPRLTIEEASAAIDMHASHTSDLFGLLSPVPAPGAVEKPEFDRWFPFLPDEPESRSFSVGTVTDGYLVNATALPMPGRTYGVLPRQLSRGLVWGGQELIETLVVASEYVEAAYPGSVMWLGNIGRRCGGDIPWSVSHNAGRDADVAFYTVDPSGAPIQPPDLLRYDRRGRSREYGGYYRFDVARNWALVKALALSPRGQVQYLFISDPLRRLLLDFATERGEPETVIARAGELLSQPGRDIPHDDHLHVRLYCARADMTAGCENIGVLRSGTETFGEARRARIEQAVGMLRAGDAEVRARAVERLVILGARDRLEDIRGRLSDPSSRVREQAVQAIAALGDSRHARWLVEYWEEESEPLVREGILRALAELGGSDAAQLLAGVLREPLLGTIGGKRYDLRLIAADASGRLGRGEPVDELIALLTSSDPELRARSAEALQLIANRDAAPLPWRERSLLSERLVQSASAWSYWHRRARDQTRREWLDAGFVDAGYAVAGRPNAVAESLANATGDSRRWVRINAQRELMALTGNEPRSLQWSRADARTYWTRWVRRNPGRIAAR